MPIAEPYLCFANWRYEQVAGRLILSGFPEHQVRLEPRLHQLLNYFLAHPMQIISKDQLMDDVWPDTEGTDAAVMRAVASLRKILQPGLSEGPCIETLSKRGYRWTLAVELQHLSAEDLPTVVLPTAVLPAESLQAPPLLWPEARMHPEHAEQVPVAVPVPQPPYEVPKRWPHLVASTVLLLCLFVGFALFLVHAGMQARQPVYNKMVNFSALKGQERAALWSPAQQWIFYQYQAPDQSEWHWLAHHSKSHKKVVAAQGFSTISRAVWLNTDFFLFQAEKNGQCHFYRQHIDLATHQSEMLMPCQQVVSHGLALDGGRLYWLAQDKETGQVQIWQQQLSDLNKGKAAELLYQFAAQYRRPRHLLAQDGQLYLVVEKDFYSDSLFQFDLALHSIRWLKDFAFDITDLSLWQHNTLLLSSAEALLQFRLSSGKVIRLQTAQTGFAEAQRVGEQLLSSYATGHNSDLQLLPVLAANPAIPGTTQLPWLHSSKNETRLAAMGDQIAFVSERSGNSQIWLYQQQLLRQLTHFQGQRQVQQLLWWQQQLYALIDLQLYQVNLSDGSLELQDINRPAQLTVCDERLLFTQWTEKGWQLWQQQSNGEAQLLLPDITAVRCAPGGQLVLQQLGSDQLKLWSGADGKLQNLPVQLNWRDTVPEQWLSTRDGLYWVAKQQGKTRLWQMDWQSQTVQQLALPETVTPQALFGGFDERALYYQSEVNIQTDIGWLSQSEPTKKPSQ